jgi:nitroreductase
MGTLTKAALSFIGKLKPDRVKRARSHRRSCCRARTPRAASPSCRRWRSAARPRVLERRAAQAVLSGVLWAAFGVNRPENNGRTAPSALGAQEIDVYAASPAAYIYDPFAHSLSLVAALDVRKVTGFQDFVDEAPLDLLYVADHAHVGVVRSTDRHAYSAVTAGAISQNVYLYCASAGLGTVVRGWLDRAPCRRRCASASEQVIIAQTVGYPRA